MAVTAPPALTDIPDFPQLADRAGGTYNSKAYAFGTHMANTFNDEISAVAANIFANATDAAEKATIATDGASTATEKANIATDAAAIAASAKTDIEALYDQFDDRYLGAKSSDPTLDNDGNALQDGAFYINSVSGYLRAYTAAGGWVQGVSAVSGVSSINSATGAITLKTLNGASLLGAGDIVLSAPAIRTPTNIAPANAATNTAKTPTLSGSPYYSLYGLGMIAAQFQISTVPDFSTFAVNTGDIVGTAVAYTVASALAGNTIHYWRARYKDNDGIYSDWSASTSFTTAAQDYIATPAATPAAFGDAFEGGFYTGMIWNELAQTATSTLIGTGSKTFAVADMTSAPIVYAGQTLEVRSRANPANKMIGTVTGAVGTSLTLNITSVGGGGTFTDWSVMAQYRVIVAPKSSGENAAIAYKNATTAAPAACQTLSEGYKATMAMVAADTATVYPAAWWCKNLSIGGKNDWYLPARDELELAWRNLKPTADANYTAARSDSTIDYKNLGSVDDADTGMGHNLNSSPQGSTYVAGTPAQVAAGKNFRTGEAEAFVYGSANYWSASEYSATTAWSQNWYSSNPGSQNNYTKTVAYVVRAVRRSII